MAMTLLLAISAAVAVAADPPPVPNESEVKFYDRPSDDGSALIVEWVAPLTQTEELAKAKAEAEKNREDVTEEQLVARIPAGAVDVTYLVQVAKTEEEFDSGAFETIEVVPGPETRKSGEPKYFGFSTANEDSCFAEILPSEMFPPDKPWALPPLAIKALMILGVESRANPGEGELISSLVIEGTIPELDGSAGEAFSAAFQIWLSQRVDEEILTESEADRAMNVWPIANKYGRDVAEAKTEATALWEEADTVFKANREARLEAEIAVGLARGEDSPGEEALASAKEALVEAKAAENKAEAKLLEAARTLEWVSENVRSALHVDQRGELDWFVRLRAHLDERHAERVEDAERETNAKTYYVRLAVNDDSQTPTYVAANDGKPAVFLAAAQQDLFKWFTLNNLIFALTFAAIVLTFIQIARRNPNLSLRKIAGLDAVEEAIGRATEMGRPAFFVHGFGGTGSMSTIAALNILSRVAHQAAEYDTRIKVMNLDPIVTAVSQEVVQQAYLEAGRPDAFDADDVVYMTSDQFSYAAAVAGRMMRERPAAIFLIGYFMAESLLLAETGASTGAIQVAGTDAEHQLPFFITTCDYTLIGEELYAASAYLSREPRMLGSLRGQDVGKAFMMVAMVVGILLMTILLAYNKDTSWITQLFEAL